MTGGASGVFGVWRREARPKGGGKARGAGRRGIPAVLKVGAASQTPPGLLLNSDSTSALQCLGH